MFFGLDLWVIGGIREEDFECDEAIESELFGLEDDSHSAATYFADDFVLAQDGTRFEVPVRVMDGVGRSVLVQGGYQGQEFGQLAGMLGVLGLIEFLGWAAILFEIV